MDLLFGLIVLFVIFFVGWLLMDKKEGTLKNGFHAPFSEDERKENASQAILFFMIFLILIGIASLFVFPSFGAIVLVGGFLWWFISAIKK